MGNQTKPILRPISLFALLISLLMGACGAGSTLCFAQQPAKTYRVPFRTARSLILVSVTVDGEPKTLIFDTGAERTLINSRDGNVERRVTFSLGSKVMGNFPIILSDLSGMSMEKVGADSVLGQDVLRKFSFVRIDYAANVLELEPKK